MHPTCHKIHLTCTKPGHTASNHHTTAVKSERLLDDFRRIAFLIFGPGMSNLNAIKSVDLVLFELMIFFSYLQESSFCVLKASIIELF